MKNLFIGLTLLMFAISCQNQNREEFSNKNTDNVKTEALRSANDTVNTSNLEIIEIDQNIPTEVFAEFETIRDVNLTSLTRMKIKLSDGRFADMFSTTRIGDESIAYVLPVIDGTFSSLARIEVSLRNDYATVTSATSLRRFTGSGLNAQGYCDYSQVDGWRECVAQCVSCVLDTNGLVGQVIATTGILGGVGCSPCGAVAAAVFAVGLVGCGGGCVGYRFYQIFLRISHEH